MQRRLVGSSPDHRTWFAARPPDLRQSVEPFVERSGVIWGGCSPLEGMIVLVNSLVRAGVDAGSGSRNVSLGSAVRRRPCRIQGRRKKGHEAGKRYSYTYRSMKSLASIIDQVPQLTRRASHRSLANLLGNRCWVTRSSFRHPARPFPASPVLDLIPTVNKIRRSGTE